MIWRLPLWFSKKSHPKLELSSKQVLWVHAATGLAGGLSNLFVGIYFWRLLSSLEAIAWFNLITFAGVMIVSPIAATLIRKRSTKTVMSWGIALQALFFLAILMLGKNTEYFLPYLGALNGFAAALFWTGMNVMTSRVSTMTQNWFLSLVQGIYAAIAILAPPISGIVINLWKDYTGYSVIFGISVALFFVAFALVLQLPDEHEDFRLKRVLDVVKRDPLWKAMSFPVFLWGFRQGVFDTLVGILTFIVLKNEFALGNFSMVMSAIAIVSAALVGRLMRNPHRPVIFLSGISMLFVGSLIFVVFREFWALLVYGLFEAVSRGPWSVTFDSYVWSIIAKRETSDGSPPLGRLEYIIHRETLLESGRIFGLAVFLVGALFVPSVELAFIMLPFLPLAFATSFFALRRIERRHAKPKVVPA